MIVFNINKVASYIHQKDRERGKGKKIKKKNKNKTKALECQTKFNMLQLPHKNDLNIKQNKTPT